MVMVTSEAAFGMAERSRKRAQRLQEAADALSTVGAEGDRKFALELQAKVALRRAKDLSSIGCDLGELELELENLND
jgi:hypothetical protein